ncbi:MAG: hypothetical protein J6Y02_16430 [Pseudobutyrivibrio sp.]|nr:hypothetical protein [Pseudobutyrivibrio sp.]
MSFDYWSKRRMQYFLEKLKGKLDQKQNCKQFYGTCDTAADVAAKVVTVSADQNFVLTTGCVVYVKFANTNTATDATLNVNGSGAKSITYGADTVITSSNGVYTGTANYTNQYMYDGTYWKFAGYSYEKDTTYSSMSLAEMREGTATSNRSIRADRLATVTNERIDGKIQELDVTGDSNIAASKTIKSWSEADGKVSVTTQDISITKSQVSDFPTYSANNGVGLSGTTFYNSGVRSIATGGSNGTISVNTNGTVADIPVKGLGSAAYTNSDSYRPVLLKRYENSGLTNNKWYKLFTVKYTSYNYLSFRMIVKDGYTPLCEALVSVRYTPNGIETNSSFINIIPSGAGGDLVRMYAIDTNTIGIAAPVSGTTSNFGFEILDETSEGNAIPISSFVVANPFVALDAAPTKFGIHRYITGSYPDLINKPTLGTAAAKDIPSSGNASTAQVVMGNDTRLTDSRTPTAHDQASNTITAMTGYSKASSAAAIVATDSLNTAIGKLEKTLDGKGTSNLALGTSSSTAFRGDYGNSAYVHAVTNKGSAFTNGLYKITTNSEGHVTAATAVAKADITALGIPGSDTNNRKAFFGTCDTAGDTAAKVVTLSDTTGWELKAGTIVGVKFTNKNTASSVTLNVNGSGAKSIWYNTAVYTDTSANVCGTASMVIYYMYDGTNWVWLNMGKLDGNTDTKVRQTLSTTNKNYPLLMSYAESSTTTGNVDNVSYRANNIYANPSTGNIQATQLNGVTIGSSPKFTDTNNRKSFFGTCDTASATAEKVVTLIDSTGWELRAGTIVGVKFTKSNSANNPTLNINNSGAKSIWYRNAVVSGNQQYLAGTSNDIIYYIYDGTYWVWIKNQYDPPRLFVGASSTGTTNAATTNGNTGLRIAFGNERMDYHLIVGTQGINVTSDDSGKISIGEHYVDVTNTLSTTADTTYTFTDSRITTDSAIDVYASIFGVNPKSVSVASGSCTVVFPKYSSAASMTARIYIK